jgi:hypothetical protein
MRAIDALARALIAAGICCGTLSGGTLAQTLGLPDVTVTAPPITPSWKKWNPYSSNPRVEEEKWPDIPCGDSRISAGGATNCRTGPPLGQDGMGAAE